MIAQVSRSRGCSADVKEVRAEQGAGEGGAGPDREAVRQVEHDEHDRGRPDQSHQSAGTTLEQGREHELDDDEPTEGQSDQGTDAAPPCHHGHHQYEQREEQQQRPAALHLQKRVDRGRSVAGRDRKQLDPVATAQTCLDHRRLHRHGHGRVRLRYARLEVAGVEADDDGSAGRVGPGRESRASGAELVGQCRIRAIGTRRQYLDDGGQGQGHAGGGELRRTDLALGRGVGGPPAHQAGYCEHGHQTERRDKHGAGSSADPDLGVESHDVVTMGVRVGDRWPSARVGQSAVTEAVAP